MESKPTKPVDIERVRKAVIGVNRLEKIDANALFWLLRFGKKNDGDWNGSPDEDAALPIAEMVDTAQDALFLLAELDDLRAEAEANRWRKWPEERPDVDGEYLCMINGVDGMKAAAQTSWYSTKPSEVEGVVGWCEVFCENRLTHWRPVTPPKEARHVEAK